MKKFGYRLLIFGLPALIFVFTTLMFYYFTQLKVQSEAKRISEYKCLLMGDSQIQRFNSNLLNSGTKNIASSAEHYYFIYNKLLKVLQNKDHKVKTVILGVSIHNFAPVYNRLFDIRFAEGKLSLERYLSFIPSLNNNDFLNNARPPLYSVIKGVYKGGDWGGGTESNYSNPDTNTINRIFRMHFSIKENEEKYSQSQKKYLNKIDSLCLSHGIDLFICSLPYHPLYQNKIEEEYFEFFYQTISELKRYYHINFLLDIPKPDWMSDASHLNKEGAAIYSKKINEIVEVLTNNDPLH